MQQGVMNMRRVSASADHRSKSPSVEARKSKVPLLVDNRWRDSSSGTVAILWRGAIGSQEALTTIPGGVQLPGAPLSFTIASIYP
jgi:hypothetical protein